MDIKDICLAVTTYKKLPALRGWLESVPNFGRVGIICICDDNNGEAQAVAEEYQSRYEAGTYPFPIAYATGENVGISRNKNRGIKFFLESPEAMDCKYLVMSDDDISFVESEFGERRIGDLLVKASENSGLKHITGYLGGNFGKINDDGTATLGSDPFFEQFVPAGEDEYLYHCGGTQGILLFFHRELVELEGYFAMFKGRYGYEHCHYSMRANRLEGRTPELYPVLKNCPNYFHCQGIPNDYIANPAENAADFQKYRIDVYNGIGLSVRESGV